MNNRLDIGFLVVSALYTCLIGLLFFIWGYNSDKKEVVKCNPPTAHEQLYSSIENDELLLCYYLPPEMGRNKLLKRELKKKS